VAVEPNSPWSRNPDSAEADPDDHALDVVATRPPSSSTPITTSPGDRIRRGARVVRWVAALLAVTSVLSSALITYGVHDEGYSPYGGGWPQFGQFLSGLTWNVGIAALVLASSYGLTALAARLDLDRTIAER
jgi:hypothetical protein